MPLVCKTISCHRLLQGCIAFGTPLHARQLISALLQCVAEFPKVHCHWKTPCFLIRRTYGYNTLESSVAPLSILIRRTNTLCSRISRTKMPAYTLSKRIKTEL